MTFTKIPGFISIPRTGVIYVMQKAADAGYRVQDKSWANLGQGAPETGSIPGEIEHNRLLDIDELSREYSPVAGTLELRKKVAELYNTFYRKGKSSQYTWKNVSISGGGRISLTRILASLGNINLGHFLPDYTAYEELLGVFKNFVSIPILTNADNNYRVPSDDIKEEIIGRGLQAILMSNPCNPTGQLIEEEALKQWISVGRDYHCSLIMDEFYSQYIYTDREQETGQPRMVSAAEYVEDVNSDPVLIVDGMTKNWRYPGYRISWTLGPEEVIESIESSGSFLDGGPNHPLQKQILPLLDPAYVKQSNQALQSCFKEKREYVLKRLEDMGIIVESPPEGTFYIWACLSNLPAPLNDGIEFFEKALQEKVITVPGIFFDINPGKRRPISRFKQYVRISFGPGMAELEKGLDAIEALIAKTNSNTRNIA